MQTPRTRAAVVSAAILSLVLASTAAVTSTSRRDDDRASTTGREGKVTRPVRDGGSAVDRRGRTERRSVSRRGGQRSLPRLQGRLTPPFASRLGPVRVMSPDFQRQETTLQTTDRTLTQRVDRGTVSSIGDASLDYALADGQAATVTTGARTAIVSLTERTFDRGRRGRTITRLVPSRISLTDIEAGTTVIVWSGSENGGDFVAQRIVVQPAPAADTGGADPAEEAPVADAEASAEPISAVG